ncbi:LysR substrate-binding domain-containing protein [Streptomyces sp. G35A]
MPPPTRWPPGPGCTWTTWSTGSSPASHGRAVEHTPRSGAARTASNLSEIFSLVETGSVVFFAPLSVARRYPRPGIAYRPVGDLQDSTLAVAWPQDARSPAVAAFVRAACTVAAAQHAQAERLTRNTPP